MADSAYLKALMEMELTKTATFSERLLHTADTVQEVFELRPSFERNLLNLTTSTILPEYYDHVLVEATANERVTHTVVHTYAPGLEDYASVVLSKLEGVADVTMGLRSIGYRAVYPEGEAPAAPGVRDRVDEDDARRPTDDEG